MTAPDAWLLVTDDGKRYVSCSAPFHSTETATAYELVRADIVAAEKAAAVREALERAASIADMWPDGVECIDGINFLVGPMIGRAIRDLIAATEEPGTEYVVWSNEHIAWWGPNRCGYTRDLAKAGRYSRDEAIRISATARGGWRRGELPPEIAMPLADAIATEAGS